MAAADEKILCNQPMLQWLRRKAVQSYTSQVVPAGRHFNQSLQSLIWSYLRFAICVPRDVPSVSAALGTIEGWPPTTILVSPGNYDEALVIDKPAELVALRGPAVTRLGAVSFKGAGSGSRLSGFKIEDAVHIHCGDPVLERCHISSHVTVKGAASPQLERVSFTSCLRTALCLREQSTSSVSKCSFEGNHSTCISVRDTASVSVFRSHLMKNGAPVIHARDASSLLIEDSTMQSNNGCGVLVRGKSRAAIKSSRLHGHKMAAVAFQHESTGSLTNCQLEENDGAVIYVNGSAAVTIEGNTIQNNGRLPPVIQFGAASGPVKAKIVAQREDNTNRLTHKLAYIEGKAGEEWVDVDEGKHRLRNQSGNTDVPYTLQEPIRAGHVHDGEGGALKGVSLSKGTKRCAIAIKEQAQATIRHNHIKSNDGYGILASDNTIPFIEDNCLTDCRHSAIVAEGAAGGHIVRNTLSNGTIGIQIQGAAAPLVEENRVYSQKNFAIRIAGTSACVIRKNHLTTRCQAIMIVESAAPILDRNSINSLEGGKPLMPEPRCAEDSGSSVNTRKRRHNSQSSGATEKEALQLLA
ncbi:unnamed protein product [Effrenium voratum]|nr:unnamed protein product [Effrenium voratum]CAJ1415808.1 unnamed protein product [Effrenium voratum]